MRVSDEQIKQEMAAFPGLGEMQAYYRIQGRAALIEQQQRTRQVQASNWIK